MGSLTCNVGSMLVEGVQVVLLKALSTPVVLLPGEAQGTGRGRSKLRHHGLHAQSSESSTCNATGGCLYTGEVCACHADPGEPNGGLGKQTAEGSNPDTGCSKAKRSHQGCLLPD